MEVTIVAWIALLTFPAAWLIFAIIASAVGANRGAHWFFGFLVGTLFGPAGLLYIYLRTGRLCWHCWTRIHLKSRVCPNCQGDVVDRRKGRASRSGFGRRKDDSMRQPTDLPSGGPSFQSQANSDS